MHSIFALAAWRRALDTPLGPAVGAALRSDRGRRRLTLHFSGLQGFMDRHLEQMASCLPSGLEHVRLHFEECPLTDLAPLWQNLQRLESCAHLDAEMQQLGGCVTVGISTSGLFGRVHTGCLLCSSVCSSKTDFLTSNVLSSFFLSPDGSVLPRT